MRFVRCLRTTLKTVVLLSGYYNNVIFHRVIRDFVSYNFRLKLTTESYNFHTTPPYTQMIQTGDPTGTGRGGESAFGGKFADEISTELKHTGAGVLSMANSGPNTNGSQFFLTLAPAPWLDGKHTIFGRVSSGMKVVQQIGSVPTNAGDKPLNEILILKAKCSLSGLLTE